MYGRLGAVGVCRGRWPSLGGAASWCASRREGRGNVGVTAVHSYIRDVEIGRAVERGVLLGNDKVVVADTGAGLVEDLSGSSEVSTECHGEDEVLGLEKSGDIASARRPIGHGNSQARGVDRRPAGRYGFGDLLTREEPH